MIGRVALYPSDRRVGDVDDQPKNKRGHQQGQDRPQDADGAAVLIEQHVVVGVELLDPLLVVGALLLEGGLEVVDVAVPCGGRPADAAPAGPVCGRVPQ